MRPSCIKTVILVVYIYYLIDNNIDFKQKYVIHFTIKHINLFNRHGLRVTNIYMLVKEVIISPFNRNEVKFYYDDLYLHTN